MRTIQKASEDLRQGRLSAVALLEECLARIDKLEPLIKAWVLVDRERAMEEARRCDRELQGGHWRGPLHGIPLGIKDIIDVFDWPTACGSKLWKNSVARQDAWVVQCLRQAGAVLIGKTVTTPWASFDPAPTRNPWKLDRSPGGSSAGSAAAVACGMCLGALASQTGGSITRPASFCGVAGLKPTYGLVPLAGAMPLAGSMDHMGVIARTVADLELMFQIIAAHTPPEPTDLTESPPTLGRLRGLFESRADPVMKEMLDGACERFRSAGATVEEVPLPSAFAEVPQRHRVVMAVEAAAYHELRLRRHPEDYDPNIRALLEEGLACPAPEYARCLEHKAELTNQLREVVRGVDAFLTPATVGPASDASSTGDPLFNSPWSYVGYPTVSIPATLTPDGLPLAIQLVGEPFEEEQQLAAAAWCENVLQWPLTDLEVRQ